MSKGIYSVLKYSSSRQSSHSSSNILSLLGYSAQPWRLHTPHERQYSFFSAWQKPTHSSQYLLFLYQRWIIIAFCVWRNFSITRNVYSETYIITSRGTYNGYNNWFQFFSKSGILHEHWKQKMGFPSFCFYSQQVLHTNNNRKFHIA